MLHGWRSGLPECFYLLHKRPGLSECFYLLHKRPGLPECFYLLHPRSNGKLCNLEEAFKVRLSKPNLAKISVILHETLQ